MRWRLDLAYDGTAFHGWARQPGLRTVQGTLEDALGTALGLSPAPSLTVAGRTDAGVHARGQVAHVDLDDGVQPAIARLRALLPEDLAVHGLAMAPQGFDARFSALSRHYRYLVGDDDRSWDPRLRLLVVRHRRRLDEAAMNRAATALLGEHDFAALCRPRAGATTVRRVLAIEWERRGDGLLAMSVGADAFCHSMVRSLVGLLVPVGEGRRDEAWPARVVAARRREPGVTVMPPHGLTLMEVRYPPDALLGQRAEQARALRTRFDPPAQGPVA